MCPGKNHFTFPGQNCRHDRTDPVSHGIKILWEMIAYHSFCKIGFAPSQEFCRMVDKRGASRASAPCSVV